MREKILKLKYMIVPIIMLLTIPSFISFIFGYEFSAHRVSKVPTVIVNHDDSLITQTFINQINENESFNVVEYSQNDNDVKSLIDRGKVAVGIIIPAGFSKNLTDGKAPNILVFYDGAQTSLVGASKGKIGEILSSIKTGFLISIGQGKLGIMPEVATNTIVPIRYTSRVIGNPTSNMTNFFIQGALLNIVQIGMVIAIILIINKGDNYKIIWIKSTTIGLIASISVFLAITIQYKCFAVPFKGSIKAAIVLTIIYNIGMSNFGAMLNLSKKGEKIEAIDSSGSVASTMMFAGYTYPIIAMPSIFSHITKYIPFTYYILPMRDLSLLGGSFQEISSDIFWLLKFMVFMWIVTFFFYKKSGKTKKVTKIREEEKNDIPNNHDVEVVIG